MLVRVSVCMLALLLVLPNIAAVPHGNVARFAQLRSTPTPTTAGAATTGKGGQDAADDDIDDPNAEDPHDAATLEGVYLGEPRPTEQQQAKARQDEAKLSTPKADQLTAYLERMIKLAYMGYCRRKREHARTFGLDELRIFRNPPTNTQLYVAVDNKAKEVLVGFRGSQMEWKNWATNGNMLPSRASSDKAPCEVTMHTGFWSVYQKTKQATHFEKAVIEMCKKHADYKLVFTGHSLGGALATVAAFDFAVWAQSEIQIDPARIYLVSFGAPRVGDKCFFDLIKKAMPNKEGSVVLAERHINRVVSVEGGKKADLVANVPAQNGPVKYMHPPGEVLVREPWGTHDKRLTYVCNDNEKQDPDCSWGFSPLLGIGRSVPVHNMYFGMSNLNVCPENAQKKK